MIVGIELFRSIPKSFYLSLKYYPFKQALKLPILVRYNTRLVSLKGKIIGRGKLRMGFNRVGLYDRKTSPAILELKGILKIEGTVSLGQGAKIIVGDSGLLEIGDNFQNSAEGAIVCMKHIKIGNNVLTSWETLIMDTDFHPVVNLETGIISDKDRNVWIDNDVWIGTRSIVLKGSKIGKGCVVAANSLVSKSFNDENLLIAGNPGIVKRKNLTWRH